MKFDHHIIITIWKIY